MAQPQQQQQQKQSLQKPTGVEDSKQEAEPPTESFVENIAAQTKATCVQLKDRTTATCLQLKGRTTTLMKDPEFQKVAIATAGGTVVFGAAGGAFGLASGVLIGSAVGLPPALLTFGLSIPVCGAIGGVGGLATGTVVGGGAGGCAGLTAYKYRVEIQDGVVVVKVRAMSAVGATKKKAIALKDQVLDVVVATKIKTESLIQDKTAKASLAVESAKVKATAKAKEALTTATTTRAGVTSTTAVTGCAVGSTMGGGAGALAGAAVGVVPALFTFGLSIPIGASIGLCCGAVTGGTVGTVSGGALGYGGFTYRKELGDVKSKVGVAAGELKAKVGKAATDMTLSMTGYGQRSSTGGSESPIEAA